MSGHADDPRLLDLKQATLGLLLQRLGELTAALVTTNNRFLQLEETARTGFAGIAAQSAGLSEQLRETRSEVVLQANQILTLQHDVLRLLQARVGEP